MYINNKTTHNAQILPIETAPTVIKKIGFIAAIAPAMTRPRRSSGNVAMIVTLSDNSATSPGDSPGILERIFLSWLLKTDPAMLH